VEAARPVYAIKGLKRQRRVGAGHPARGTAKPLRFRETVWIVAELTPDRVRGEPNAAAVRAVCKGFHRFVGRASTGSLKRERALGR
jgi:hypothetical protein